MGVKASVYEEINREYGELRAEKERERALKVAEIEEAVPEFSRLEAEITSLCAKRAMLRLRGAGAGDARVSPAPAGAGDARVLTARVGEDETIPARENEETSADAGDARVLTAPAREDDARVLTAPARENDARVSPARAGEDERLREKISRLRMKRRDLLGAAGYSEDDLKVRYTCGICLDTGYTEEGAMCRCMKRRLTEKLYDFSHIKPVLERENFETFDYGYYSRDGAVDKSGRSAYDVAREAVGKVRDFVENFGRQGENIYLCGGTGVGKTFLANCAAKELIEAGWCVVYLSAVRLFDVLADEAFERDKAEGRPGMDMIYESDLLIIDDLGTEMTNSFVQTQLFNCVNERLLRDKHTIISSNLSPAELQSVYSERVFSRVSGAYTIIKLYADDIRIQKKLRRI